MLIICGSCVYDQVSWYVAVLEGLDDLYSIIAVRTEARWS